jgi:hypothetical protein
MSALVEALSTYGLTPAIVKATTAVQNWRSEIPASELASGRSSPLRRRARLRSGGAVFPPVIPVADRITDGGREALAAAGVQYFDRRGPLRVVSPPLVIDTIVETTGPSGTPTTPPTCHPAPAIRPRHRRLRQPVTKLSSFRGPRASDKCRRLRARSRQVTAARYGWARCRCGRAIDRTIRVELRCDEIEGNRT